MGNEGGRRSGTLNVPGIVGLGEACSIAFKERAEECYRIQELRDSLLQGLRNSIPNLRVNGSMELRVSGNLHISLKDTTSENVPMQLGGDAAISSDSACNFRS